MKDSRGGPVKYWDVDLEDLGPNDVYFTVYLNFELSHRLTQALASIAYLITIHEVDFCIYVPSTSCENTLGATPFACLPHP